MVERLSDEQVADLTGHWDWKMTNLAREVQEWRALIPEVIEQLEALRSWWNDTQTPLDAIIAKLREVIK